MENQDSQWYGAGVANFGHYNEAPSFRHLCKQEDGLSGPLPVPDFIILLKTFLENLRPWIRPNNDNMNPRIPLYVDFFKSASDFVESLFIFFISNKLPNLFWLKPQNKKIKRTKEIFF